MLRMLKFRKIFFCVNVCFILIIFLTVVVYLPGLKGDFLFDDYVNLDELTRYGDLNNWENIKKFILNGIAGPSGRPISLITFVPQADFWPNDPLPFKIINLIIHLMCGALLYKVTSLLLSSYGYKETESIWIAFISSSIWLLHPFYVSTTLYVIQRMAQLPLLFSLLGILGYLKGRSYISYNVLNAYLLMTISIVSGTILATLSKENGALLPLLLLIIEFCNPLKENKPILIWRVIFLWFPSLLIGFILVYYIDFSDNPWPNRTFNQIERILTEGRVLCEYLFNLYVPKIEGYGLFQDGYIVSKSIVNPMSTLISFIFIIVVLSSSFLIRKKYPLFSLSILFFFAAHLVESTVIGLELYFEHRNYLAAIFIFLPFISSVFYFLEKIKISIFVMGFILILMTLSWLTWQRSILWSNDLKLQLYWAQNNLNSPRAQSLIAQQLLLNDKEEESIYVLEHAIERRPDSGMLSFQILLEKVVLLKATQNDFHMTALRMKKFKPDSQTMIWVRDLTLNIANNQNLLHKYADAMSELLLKMGEGNLQYVFIPEYQEKLFFLQSTLFAAQDKKELAYLYAIKAFNVNHDIELGIYLASDLGNRGARKQAVSLLNIVLLSLNKRSIDTSKLYYEHKITELRERIYKDIQIEKSNLKMNES